MYEKQLFESRNKSMETSDLLFIPNESENAEWNTGMLRDHLWREFSATFKKNYSSEWKYVSFKSRSDSKNAKKWINASLYGRPNPVDWTYQKT